MTMTNERPIEAHEITNPHWTGADASGRWATTAQALVPALAASAATLDMSGEFVHEGFALLRDQKLMSMLVPEELGGGGASHADACAVLAELAHGCPSTSLAFAMHSHLVAAQVWQHHRGMPAPVLEKVAAQQLVLVSTGAADWLDSSGTAERVEGEACAPPARTPWCSTTCSCLTPRCR